MLKVRWNSNATPLDDEVARVVVFGLVQSLLYTQNDVVVTYETGQEYVILLIRQAVAQGNIVHAVTLSNGRERTTVSKDGSPGRVGVVPHTIEQIVKDLNNTERSLLDSEPQTEVSTDTLL